MGRGSRAPPGRTRADAPRAFHAVRGPAPQTVLASPCAIVSSGALPRPACAGPGLRSCRSRTAVSTASPAAGTVSAASAGRARGRRCVPSRRRRPTSLCKSQKYSSSPLPEEHTCFRGQFLSSSPGPSRTFIADISAARPPPDVLHRASCHARPLSSSQPAAALATVGRRWPRRWPRAATLSHPLLLGTRFAPACGVWWVVLFLRGD